MRYIYVSYYEDSFPKIKRYLSSAPILLKIAYFEFLILSCTCQVDGRQHQYFMSSLLFVMRRQCIIILRIFFIL